jgi:hypothetical protein
VDLVLSTPMWHRLLGAGGFLTAALVPVGLTWDHGAVARVAAGAVAAGLVVVAARLWMLKVEIRSGQLIVVNWVRTVRRPLAEVRYFTSEAGDWSAVMRDGSYLVADVFGPRVSPPVLAGHAEQAARSCQAALRDERRRARHDGTDGQAGRSG